MYNQAQNVTVETGELCECAVKQESLQVRLEEILETSGNTAKEVVCANGIDTRAIRTLLFAIEQHVIALHVLPM